MFDMVDHIIPYITALVTGNIDLTAWSGDPHAMGWCGSHQPSVQHHLFSGGLFAQPPSPRLWLRRGLQRAGTPTQILTWPGKCGHDMSGYVIEQALLQCSAGFPAQEIRKGRPKKAAQWTTEALSFASLMGLLGSVALVSWWRWVQLSTWPQVPQKSHKKVRKVAKHIPVPYRLL